MNQQTTLTDEQLIEIGERASHLHEYATLTDKPLQDDADELTGEDVPALITTVRRLRADAAADLLPTWEAMYEPGNVSDYLIGYANSEAGAKGAAEAWMRSESEVTGRLEWVPQNPLDGYDREFELAERHDDDIDTGPGISVRRRATVPAPAVAAR